MARPYDRTRYYMKMNEFVKIIGMNNEKAFFKIGLVETMAQMHVLFADALQGMDIPGQPTDPQPVGFLFDEPVQELRLIQVRATLNPVTRAVGAQPVLDNIPPTIEVEWNSPKTERRGGTDKQADVTMNGIANNNLGGREGGRIPGNQIRRLVDGDPNPVFDIFIIRGYNPAFNILNGSPLPLGGGLGGNWDNQWYIPNEGRRYVLGNPSEEEVRGLLKRKIPYRAVSIGGIPTNTMEA